MSNSAFQQRQTGNASETGAGSVEMATAAEVAARTDIGGSGAPLFVRPSHLAPAPLLSEFVAGEDLTVGQPVFLAHYFPSTANLINNQDAETEITPTSTLWFAQKFTVPTNPNVIDFTSINVLARDKQGDSTDVQITIRLRSSLTGANLASVTSSVVPNTPTWMGLSVAGLLTQGQSYYVVVSYNHATYGTWYKTTDQTPLVNGERWQSVDSGANWTKLNTTGNGDDFNILLQANVDGSLGHNKWFKGAAASFNNRFGVMGFVKTAATAGNYPEIQLGWKWQGLFSGLTPGSTYYLTDTPGVISTTPGTMVVPVGIAASSDTLINLPVNGGYAARPITFTTGDIVFQQPGLLISANTSANSDCTYYRPAAYGDLSWNSIFVTPPVRTTDPMLITRGMRALLSATNAVFFPFISI